MAAAYTGRARAMPNLITYDMGGTSTDVGLIEDAVTAGLGRARARICHADPRADGRRAHDRRRRRLDRLGRCGRHAACRAGERGCPAGPDLLRPRRAEPTITDANLVLGRLNPSGLLGVDMPVTLDHVSAADRAKVGKRLGLDADRRRRRHPAHRQRPHGRRHALVSLSRGHDPRDFALFAFGGAGPCTPRRWPRACDSDRAGAAPGPASPMRWAASSPTCATTMCAR
jgi:N-methylhydantoinase A